MLLRQQRLTFITLILNFVSGEDVFVDLEQGRLKGYSDKTLRFKKTFYSFKGIPYAKPRVGEEKFEVAEPAEAWDGVLDATEYRAKCVHYCMIRRTIYGEDDCLHLSVHTPLISEETCNPVILIIHASMYGSNSANWELFATDYFLEYNQVTVTFNYRHGVTGLISTSDASAPGNVGMKDQVLVLKWVQKNIRKFGGCPDKVTFLGGSAGGSSIHHHLLSPMSRGLFHRAFITGGSALSPFSFSTEARKEAFELGEYLGIKTDDSAELMSKLKKIDSITLLAASFKMAHERRVLDGHLRSFNPTVEPDLGQERFLTDNPWQTLTSGDIADIPIIFGFCKDEALFMTSEVMGNSLNRHVFNKHFNLFVPYFLNATDPAEREEIAKSMKQFYFDNMPISSETEDDLTMMMSDSIFIHPIVFSAKITSFRINSPVYIFMFTHKNTIGTFKSFFGTNEDGVPHTEEQYYYFNSPILNYTMSPVQLKIVTYLGKMIANFANEGNPTAVMDEDVNVKWPPLREDNNDYMIIDSKPSIQKDVYKDRMTFWAKIFSYILGDYTKLFL